MRRLLAAQCEHLSSILIFERAAVKLCGIARGKTDVGALSTDFIQAGRRRVARFLSSGVRLHHDDRGLAVL